MAFKRILLERFNINCSKKIYNYYIILLTKKMWISIINEIFIDKIDDKVLIFTFYHVIVKFVSEFMTMSFFLDSSIELSVLNFLKIYG